MVELEPPTPGMREDFILNNVFGLAAIQSIGYELDTPSFVSSEALFLRELAFACGSIFGKPSRRPRYRKSNGYF